MAYLGIDIGSLYVSLAMVDENGGILKKAYVRHHGEPANALKGALSDFPLDQVTGFVRTGSGGQDLPIGGKYINSIVSQVEGVKAMNLDAKNIIYIGGGSFSLTRLDEDGNYNKSTSNSACASGTGAFLDQQAMRLQVEPHELSKKAMSYTGKIPGVATRCAVFAKSDMIHLQQEGYSTDAISAGLCSGLGHSTVDGLLNGHTLKGKTVCIGGVAKNSVVVKGVTEKLGVDVTVPEEPELVSALGAANYARIHKMENSLTLENLDKKKEENKDQKTSFLRPKLELKLSKYPDFKYHDYYVDENNSEIAIIKPRSGNIEVTLGIDIGSTSTKAAILDYNKEMVAWIYRKTAGDPIGAVQKLLGAVRSLQKKAGFTLDIKGVGTTGSGRKMIKEVIGADLAINEITAHAKAAVFLDPQVDTILELGGQDAKFTQLQNGVVYNSIMNYVCAAGTGSFIEEQALKLGVPIAEYADFAMGKECPKTSDRCTVYMERDLDLLLARGWNKSQVAASVLHSVRDNYLNKVVGGLYIGEHVCFQGATARNKALVAAFEVELGVPVKVSPYCHVTGSLGMCLLVQERLSGTTSFKGLGFADEKVSIEYETCELCHNLCSLSIIKTEDTTVAWGLKCGRDYESTKPVVKKNLGYEFLRKRDLAWRKDLHLEKKGPTVGLPRALGIYGYVPMWRAFFQGLDCNVRLSGKSCDEIMKNGTALSTAEYCAPVLMSHGHIKQLAENSEIDHIFLPYLIREKNPHNFTDSHFCCYLQAHPGVISSIKNLNVKDKLISPIIQFQQSRNYMLDRLEETVGEKLRKNRQEISLAYNAGIKAQKAFEKECLELGTQGLQKIKDENTLGIVIVGRPYNSMDPGMALDLPRKIAEMGYNVLNLDMLPLDYSNVQKEHHNMYWYYGQKILAAADYILNNDNLFGVYFTNFMCGPDSYIQTYFKEAMAKKQKPYISLQFDGHGADAGYLTRIEAALESFHSWKGIPRPQVEEGLKAVKEPVAK